MNQRVLSGQKWLGAAVVLVMTHLAVEAQAIPVIPGAPGFGIETPAGRGGQVFIVNTVAASGTGSLKACIDATVPRVCVFETSGVIRLTHELVIRSPYITIAGQTAPSPGIMILGAGITVLTHDVLVQHLRIRAGDDPVGPSPQNRGPFHIANADVPPTNVVVDHCSLSWSTDQVLTVWYDSGDITFRQLLATEALHDSIHVDEGVTDGTTDPHAMGPTFGQSHGRITMYGSLMAHNRERQPMSLIEELVWVNNVHYNRSFRFAQLHNRGGIRSDNTFIGNVYIDGPSLGSNTPLRPIWLSSEFGSTSRIYLADNFWSRLPNPTSPWDLVTNGSSATRAQVEATSPPTNVPGLVPRPTANNQVLDWVLANAGARPIERDSVDRRIINDVRNGTGRLVNCVAADGSTRCQANAGGWPTLTENHRTPAVPTDRNGDADGDGYTNLEEWLHAQAALVEGVPQAPATFSADTTFGPRASYRELTPSRWSIAQDGGDWRYFLNTSAFDGGATSGLGEYTLFNGRTYGDFNLTARVRTAETLSGNTGADVDLVFGYQNADNYYYLMLSNSAVNNALFRYVGGVRTLVANLSAAVITDTNYHDVRLSRRGGTITLTVDGTQRLNTTDTTLGVGSVGFGSFNDSAYFDDVRVVEPAPVVFSGVPQLGSRASYTEFTPSRWSVVEEGSDLRYFLNTSAYDGGATSGLGEYTLVTSSRYADFELSLRAKPAESLTANTSADLDVVFGYQDANNYYYLMLSNSPLNNQLFRYVAGVRTMIGNVGAALITDSNYRDIRITRFGGAISVWVDGLQQIAANDATFGAGAIGFGSFNDSAYFDDLRVSEPGPNVFSPVPYFGDRASYDEVTPARWSITPDGNDRRYFLNTSAFDGGATSGLGEYTLVNERSFGDFDLDVRVRTAEVLAGNTSADVCLVFGYRDPANYYYVMLSNSAVNNQLFRYVNGVRTGIATASAALITDTNYHRVRLSRRGAAVTVSVDGVLRLSGSDTTFPTGAVGMGSFNDSFYFDDLNVTLPGVLGRSCGGVGCGLEADDEDAELLINYDDEQLPPSCAGVALTPVASVLSILALVRRRRRSR